MLDVLAVQAYRSLRRLVVPMGQLTVVTGANGSGKSSLYRVLRLLAATARGGAVAALAAEGGLSSVLWAGPERIGRSVREGRDPVQAPCATNRSRCAWASPAVNSGTPSTSGRRSRRCPWSAGIRRSRPRRSGPGRSCALPSGCRNAAGSRSCGERQSVLWRGAGGSWTDSGRHLRPTDSVLAEVADPVAAPEVPAVRDQVRSWRFYDAFRTDPAAPARAAKPGTWTPVMADERSDLASALATLNELEHGRDLDAAIERAFAGSRIEIDDTDGLFGVRLHQRGLLRPLGAAELIAHAAVTTQTVVVTHSAAVQEALRDAEAGPS